MRATGKARVGAALFGALAFGGVQLIGASPALAGDFTIQATCYRTVSVVGGDVGVSGESIPSAGSTAASTACGMAQGANSAAVKTLQQTLKYCYNQNIAIDSDFGPATKTALRNAQRSEGITADGVYGTQTRNTLIWWTGTTTYNCNSIVLPVRLA
ncbi:peptidoglycan-binding domain-containing protein [Micromonospora sp. NPDC127501]|uniref:peptidoglycan-binding domain-containing protein n=1 Tax=Micromonospora sp. NPDC127501 TaxID=3154872 RepID=UPI003326C08C